MENIFIVVAQSPISQIPSKVNEGGQVETSTLTVREPGSKYSNSYAVHLYGEQARQTYRCGELLLMALKFQAKPWASDVFQQVTAEEIVRINNNTNNQTHEKEYFKTPF